MRQGKQVLQITQSMASSLDRAHAVAEVLCRLANEGLTIDQLHLKKKALLEDQCLDVHALGLDANQKDELGRRSELYAKIKATPRPAADGRMQCSSIMQALIQLRDRVVSSELPSAMHFQSILETVEKKMREHYKGYPLIV